MRGNDARRALEIFVNILSVRDVILNKYLSFDLCLLIIPGVI